MPRVLVIDDEVAILRVLTTGLRARGYEVDTAQTGEAGLARAALDNPDVIVLCHGGPIAEPDDAAYVLERTTGVVGFFGASSMERLPTEVAMTENMRRFKAIVT